MKFRDTKFRKILQQKITFVYREMVIIFHKILQTNTTKFREKIAQNFAIVNLVA
jgi:hypothetical protein